MHTLWPLLALAAMNLAYCYRFYAGSFPIEGDAAYYLYYLVHPELYQAGHNPFQWDYSSLMLWAKNPILSVFTVLFSWVGPEDALARALVTAWSTAAFNSFLISASGYALFRYLKLSPTASLIGAIPLTFTGLHLNSIREFNFNFQISLMCVGPMLIAFFEIPRSNCRLRWTLLAALSIGFSLLGASNVPLFYFLPYACFIPIFCFITHRAYSRILKDYICYAAACVLGIIIAAEKIIPGITSLKDSNRGDVRLDNILHSMPPSDKVASLFLRDWWLNRPGNYHEQDYFLGLPVVILAVLGMARSFQDKGKKEVRYTMMLFFLASLVITHLCFLPVPVSDFIDKIYSPLSMRNSNRFFLLALLPLSYFAALGFEHTNKKALLWVSVFLLTVKCLWLYTYLKPVWEIALPDRRIAAAFSISFALLATACLVFNRAFLFTPALFLMYYFAPIQLTGYSDFYRENSQALGSLSSDRFNFSSLIGIPPKFDKPLQQMRSLFQEAPLVLRQPDTQEGKILDENIPSPVRLEHFNLFAPQTGHKFAFSQRDMHTSMRTLSDLYLRRSESILDLAGICWVLPQGDRMLMRRSTCMPEHFLVGGAASFGADRDVLEWMASPRDWRKALAVNCSETACELLPKEKDLPTGEVRPLQMKPGAFLFETESQKESLLFLSLVFHRGWSARVNGHPVKPIRANHAYMAVKVPAGNARIELKYSDMVYQYSAYLTYFSLLAVTTALIFFFFEFPFDALGMRRVQRCAKLFAGRSIWSSAISSGNTNE